jgi:hypothetical protein
MDAMGRLAHVFLTTGDDDGTVSQFDGLGSQGHGTQARAAQLVNAIGGFFDRDAGADGGLAGRVLTLTGGENLSHDYFVDIVRIDIGSPESFYNGDFSKIVGGNGT